MTESTLAAPNYFDYGRAEVCQDAFTAWLASWADQRFADRDSELHDLGCSFVRALAQASGRIAPLPAEVRVECQREWLDVVIEVGDEMVLAIENKVGSRARARQLYRHAHRASRWKNRRGDPWPEVCMVFVTTGRDASRVVLENPIWGVFDRSAFLALLPPEHSNQVVREFRDRLEVIEIEHFDWLATPVRSWSREGGWTRYRRLVEKELYESGMQAEWESLRSRGTKHPWIWPRHGLRVCVWPRGKGLKQTHQEFLARAAQCPEPPFRLLAPAFDARTKQTYIGLACLGDSEYGVPVDGFGRLDEATLRLQLDQLMRLVRVVP